jgi:hypothetical protein
LWQREWLSGEILERQVEYWRQALAGVEPLARATDQPRPAVASRRSRTIAVSLDKHTVEKLRALTRREGARLLVTLLAGWQLLLGRYSRQCEITVGTPIASRNRLETEPLIGFLVNTLALRTRWEGDPLFTELLRQVRSNVLAAYQHQDVPFERLVEKLSPTISTAVRSFK